MDLLDSILNGMEKPPTVRKPEIKDKEKKEKLEQMAKERQEAVRKHKEAVRNFRENVSKRVKEFVNKPITDDVATFRLDLEPMSKLHRSVVHEACEDHAEELVVHSFGTEEVDKHCTIWKRGFEPCEEEIRALKLGVEYKPKGESEDDDDEQERADAASSKTEDGKDKFWSKYEKIIGENASGLESARATLPAKQYGCVPIEKKKDQRSIEQMMDDIRKSKRQKIAESSAERSVDGVQRSTSMDEKEKDEEQAGKR